MTPPRRTVSADTVAVTGGRPPARPDAPLNPPVVLASTYVAGGELEYGRYANPTWQALERTLGELEGGHGLVFPSGLAAFGTLLGLVPPDGVVVVPRHAYLGSLEVLATRAERHGLQVRQVDIADTDAVASACDGADLLMVESPTNPALEVADLAAVCHLGRAAGALVVVDNTFATPFGQQPLAFGAHVVLHSATKYISGHSDVVLGAVVSADPGIIDALAKARGLSGAVPAPFETWLALRGLRTLHLRVERAGANAALLAARLAAHPACERVRYPGLPEDPGHARANKQMLGYGGIIAIELRGGPAAADALCGATSLWVHATSLGGVESTLERRRRWPDEAVSIPANLVRLSVGIEDPEDLWMDLDQALTRITSPSS